MVQLIRAEHIDIPKWDACVRNALHENFFGYSWYLNAICDHWDALVLGDYDAVFPLPTKRKFGLRIVYQPFFSRLFSIYASRDLVENEKQLFFNRIKKRFPRVLLGYESNNGFIPKGFKHELYKYQVLDLNQPIETIRSNYSTNAIRLIKKANKADLVMQNISTRLVVDLFEQTKGALIKEMDVSSFSHLHQLMEACMDQDCGVSIAAVNSDGETCATAFFIVHSQTVFYLKGATNELGRKNGAMFFLFDQIINRYANQSYMLDFGGSRISSVAEFYKKFGSVDQEYLFLSKNLF